LAFGVIRSKPSAVATTTLPLATAGEDVTGEAASYSQDFLAAGEIEPVDAAVVGADEYAAAGDRRRRTARVSPDLRPAIVGAPAYFESHAKPASPRDLLQHRCIRFRHWGESVYKWELDKGNQLLEIAVNGSLILDELDLVIQGPSMAPVSRGWRKIAWWHTSPVEHSCACSKIGVRRSQGSFCTSRAASSSRPH